MSKVHNQKLLENSINRCDSLGGSLLERVYDITKEKIVTLKKDEQAVMDYIFGKTDENPLAAFTDEITRQTDEYQAICQGLTASVLNSKAE